MTRNLVTADLHLSANRRDAYRVRTMRRLVKRAKAAGVTRSIILGDLTEEKDRHGDWLVNQVVEIIRLFAELGDVDILQGNHDYFSDPECPFFGFLRHMPQVRWIGKPTSIVTKGLGRVMWLPHVGRGTSKWDVSTFKDHQLFFAHGAFVGADVGHGHKVPGGIPIECFPRGARVIAGDVHIPRSFGCVEYVGAPYTVDFGDEYQPRALILDAIGVQEDLRLDDLPQKRLVEITHLDELEKFTDVYAGDIVKVRMHVARRDAPNWPDMRNTIQMWSQRIGVTLNSAVPVMVEKPGKRLEIKAQDVKSDETVLHEFARHRGMDKRTLRRGEKFL